MQDDNADTNLLTELNRRKPDKIIALGKRIADSINNTPYQSRTLAGWVLLKPPNAGVSLVMEAEAFSQQLQQAAPFIHKVYVVQEQSRQSIASQTINPSSKPTLIVREGQDMIATIRLLGNLAETEAIPGEAILVPANLPANILYEIAKIAWTRKIILLSTNVAHLENAVLMVFYPDETALGQQLAEMIQQDRFNLRIPQNGESGLKPESRPASRHHDRASQTQVICGDSAMMMQLKQLNIRQRYHLIILATLALAGLLLLISLYFVIRNYANAYTNRYWQNHTIVFAESAQFGVIMGAKSRTEAIVDTFSHNQNVLKAAIYNRQHQVLAQNGKAVQCPGSQPMVDQDQALYRETDSFWCFYAPIAQDAPSGVLEQQMANEPKTEIVGYVELIVAKAEVNALLQRIMLVVSLVVLTFLAFIFMVLRRTSGTFTVPMLDMIGVLKQVANGQSGARVAFSGNLEIVEMGEAFNQVLTKIETNERELEQKISDRTHELSVALDASQAANRYKSQIVATVSHEMKSPLHVIQNCLATSLAALPDNPGNALMREAHQRALQRTGELNDLINNILLHGKLEANSVEVKLQPLDVLPLMQACAERLEPFLKRQRNSLKLLGTRCTITSDSDLLTHIVNNLLHNVCKFTMDGEITLNWWLKDSQFVTPSKCPITAAG